MGCVEAMITRNSNCEDPPNIATMRIISKKIKYFSPASQPEGLELTNLGTQDLEIAFKHCVCLVGVCVSERNINKTL